MNDKLNKVLEQLTEYEQQDMIEHFIIIYGLRDYMPLTSIAPLNDTFVKTDYKDVDVVIRTLPKIAKALEDKAGEK